MITLIPRALKDVTYWNQMFLKKILQTERLTTRKTKIFAFILSKYHTIKASCENCMNLKRVVIMTFEVFAMQLGQQTVHWIAIFGCFQVPGTKFKISSRQCTHGFPLAFSALCHFLSTVVLVFQSAHTSALAFPVARERRKEKRSRYR